MIRYTAQNTELPDFNQQKVSSWINQVAAYYGKQVGNINYIFCDDPTILQVNQQYLQHDYYTDVITFDYSIQRTISGDIYISVDTVRTNAEQVGDSFERELLRIIIHGVLHLTGQADKTPTARTEMTNKENHALSLLDPDIFL